MAAVMTRWSVASSIVADGNVKLDSVVGRGDGVLTLLRRSLGVSFLVGSDRKADGFGDEEVCERVTRLSTLSAAGAVTFVAADALDAAASSAVSSSPQGHMETQTDALNMWKEGERKHPSGSEVNVC